MSADASRNSEAARANSKVVLMTTGFPALSQTFVVDQIVALEEAGFALDIVARQRDPSGLISERGRSLAARAAYAHDRIPFGSLLPGKLRQRIANRLSPRYLYGPYLRGADLVIAHFGNMGLAAAKALADDAKTKIWTIFHGFDITSFVEIHGRDVYRLLFERGDRFFAVNSLWVQRLEELGCPADRISVLRMGIDPARFPYRAPETRKGPLRMLGVGRLVEKKGFAFALRALAQLAVIDPQLEWHFELVGDGQLKPELMELADRLGLSDRVNFAGALPPDDIRYRLSRSDLFLLPAVTAADKDMEGIPVSLMEAMASGVVVLSTRHSGIPELIDEGHSGLLAEERDWESLATNIQKAARDPALRKRLAENARMKIEGEFNSRKINEALAGAIGQALGGPASDSYSS